MCIYSKCNVALMADRSWRQEVTSFACVFFVGHTMQCFLKKESINMIRISIIVIHSLQYRHDLCVNSDYKSIWNLNASTCKCNQMCTVCPSIIVFHYATREANQKKQDQGISSISIQFWYNSCIWLPMIRSIWSCRWDRRDCFPQIWKRHIPWKPPWLLTRELQDFGYHLTSSTSHSVMEDRILRLTCLTPRQLIWDLCSSRQSTDWREFFFLPSPILLSHPLHEGLLFQT